MQRPWWNSLQLKNKNYWSNSNQIWQIRISTDTKEAMNCMWICLSKLVTSGVPPPVSSRIAWYIQIQTSLQLFQIRVSVYCFLSIKVTRKTTVGSWQDLVSCEVVTLDIFFLKLCTGQCAVVSEAVLFCFLLSLPLLCLLPCSFLESNWLGTTPISTYIPLPYFTALGLSLHNNLISGNMLISDIAYYFCMQICKWCSFLQ